MNLGLPVLDEAATGAPPAILRHASQRLAGPLRSAVDQLHPDLSRICRYHFGWCDVDGNDVEPVPSKLFRASLVLLAGRLNGTDGEKPVDAAVAIELLHNFSLLHDDIMDADATRRGRAAAWVVYGIGPVTLAGDALIASAFQSAQAYSGKTGQFVATCLDDALAGMIAGQAADLALEHAERLADFGQYLEACEKTSALLAAAASVGALASGANGAVVKRVERAARNLGRSWQIANDVQDIWSDPEVTGKPAKSDIRRRKQTAPVILAMTSSKPASAQVSRAWRELTTDPSSDSVQRVADLIDEAGGRARAEACSASYLDDALAQLEDLPCDEILRTQLEALFQWVVDEAKR